jgi:hypothetical protein
MNAHLCEMTNASRGGMEAWRDIAFSMHHVILLFKKYIIDTITDKCYNIAQIGSTGAHPLVRPIFIFYEGVSSYDQLQNPPPPQVRCLCRKWQATLPQSA